MEVRWNNVVVWATACFTLVSTNMQPVFIHDMNNLALLESTPVGSVVYRLQGIDPEDMPIKYNLVGTDKFSVDPDTGVVTLDRPLDREEQEKLEFVVSIEDEDTENTLSLVQPVTVTVLDENDTPPIFKKRRYEVNVPENKKIGMTILRNIEVVDKDTVGDTLTVTCESNEQWPDACTTFDMVPLNSSQQHYKGKLVLRKPLDYSAKRFYRYHMYADDGQLKSKSRIEIKVLDVQNSPPVFKGSLNKVIPKDAPVGTLVLVVKAKDGDVAKPRNVVLELVHNPLDLFELNRVTGELRTVKPLDRNGFTDPFLSIHLVVRATEIVNGVPLISESTSTVATVTITIDNVEDGIDSYIAPMMRYRVLGDGRIPLSRYFSF